VGHNVVFWSPVPGQTGTTTNLIAAAGLLGLEYSARLLLFGHLQSRRAAIEQAFVRCRTQVGDEAFATDSGIDALVRLAQNRKLTSTMIRDYTVPLLKDRLDLLPGSNKADKALIPGLKQLLPPLLDTAKRDYDLTLIDGGSGMGSAWAQALLQNADSVVVCLNQNRFVLERFFGSPESGPLLNGKKRLLVLGQYDRRSMSTAKNVARRCKLRFPLYPVSHNAGFMDAAQEGRALDFMFRNRNAPRDHDNHDFMRNVRALAQAIAEQAAMNKPFFGGKGE
jgi:cellulose biosynthesis protein BcsQ